VAFNKSKVLLYYGYIDFYEATQQMLLAHVFTLVFVNV